MIRWWTAKFDRMMRLSHGCFHIGPISSPLSTTTLGYTSGSYWLTIDQSTLQPEIWYDSLPAEGGFTQTDVCSCEIPALSPVPVSSVSDKAAVEMSTVILTDCTGARSTRRLLQYHIQYTEGSSCHRTVISKVSKETASENAENCRFRQSHCRLTPSPQGTSVNICINLNTPETSHWPTFLLPTVCVCLHSNFCGGLRKTHHWYDMI